MNILAVIPARHGSTRFPGKPLASVAGLPMIQRVYTRVAASGACDKVVVATDDERIASVVREFGGHVVMTSQDCPNGTMRCHEAVVALEAEGAHVDAVLNIQGDEPFVHPEQITQLADMLRKPDAAVVTLAKSMPADPEIHSPHRVKVVRNLQSLHLFIISRTLHHIPLRDLPGVLSDRKACYCISSSDPLQSIGQK